MNPEDMNLYETKSGRAGRRRSNFDGKGLFSVGNIHPGGPPAN